MSDDSSEGGSQVVGHHLAFGMRSGEQTRGLAKRLRGLGVLALTKKRVAQMVNVKSILRVETMGLAVTPFGLSPFRGVAQGVAGLTHVNGIVWR